MEELDEFEGGEEVDYDFNLDDDLLNEETEPQAAATETVNKPAPDAIVTQPATAEAKTEKAAEPKAEPISAASATATPVAAQVSAPAPVKPKKHKFSGLEETETPAAAAPATYQPPTQEQIMAQRLKEATQMARDQQRRGNSTQGIGAKPFVPGRGGARPLSAGRGPAANGRGAGRLDGKLGDRPRLENRLSGGRGDAQRGGRGMQGRGGPAGRVGPGRGGPRPAQDFANRPKPPGVSGSGLQFNRPSGPPIPPPQAPWMGGKGPAPSAGMQMGLNPAAQAFLPMPPGLPMPSGMGFNPMMSRLKQFAGDIFGNAQMGGDRGQMESRNGSSKDWDRFGRRGDDDRETGRSRPGGPPKLVGDFDAGEEFEPPKKRPTPELRNFGALGDRSGLALPPMRRPPQDPPKAGPTAAEMEAAEKARKRQEEETARKAEIQKRIDAQKEENALLTRLRELERQVEMNKLRESIAKLEAQAAATAPPEAAKPSSAAKPAPVSAPTKRTVREVAPASAGRKSTSAAQETSPAKRKSWSRQEAEPERVKRGRSPARSPSPPAYSKSRGRQVGEIDTARPDRMRSSGGRADNSARYNDEPSSERASQDLRAYLEQKKQRSKRPESDSDYKRGGRSGR